MKQYNICLIGFGNVGKAFAKLVERKAMDLSSRGIQLKITAIATGSHGKAFNPGGIDAESALKAYAKNALSSLSTERTENDVAAFIRASHAQFLVETSPVNYVDGQPAIMHIETALNCDMHAVSANKGPVVHAFRKLNEIANKQGRKFLFESAVMDGAPVFSVFREALPAANMLGFVGILNSCTNLLIEQMEAGRSFEEAVAFAQSIGIAETDPSGDIDGWDAAIKVAALTTVLMQHPMKPNEVKRKGIREITPNDIRKACSDGKRWKLVCRAAKINGMITTSVQPEVVDATSPLYSVNGTSSLVIFKTDVLPGLGILESDPGPETTAYGLMADILNILKAA